MSIDWSKPIQIRSGIPAKLISTEGRGESTHIVLLSDPEPDSNRVIFVDCKGLFKFENSCDIVNAAVLKRKGWLNVYPSEQSRRRDSDGYSPNDYLYRDRRHADETAGSTRIACVEVEWEEPV